VSLDVLSWRRRTAAVYELVRAEMYPPVAHAGWAASREDLFRTHPASPVTGGQSWPGLSVAPYDPQWRAEVALEPAAPQRIELPTGTDGVVPFERIGLLRTPWGNLDVWWLASYGGGVWVPVRDRSSGSTSYGGGRYLLDTVKGADLGSSDDGRLVVDLNFLYAPSCAHDETWSCPLAPPGNVLDARVTAGELLQRAE
jgi:uncharacterized protein (DUF1684 family)